MTVLGPAELLLLPLGLGLLGFVEPCSIGATLLFIKFLEGKPAGAKVAQVLIFTATRTLFIGALGAGAALIGTAFVGFQTMMWIALGALYMAIGVIVATGRTKALMRTVGPGFSRLDDARGAVGLGFLFGLNIPACAAPLIFALLGLAAAGGATTGAMAQGFVALSLFGFALSLPLVLAILFGPACRALDWLAGLAARVPLVTGLVLIGLGIWAISFGLYVNPEDWT